MIVLLLPAVFDLTGRVGGHAADLAITDEKLSLGVSIVLLLLYCANLVYTLVTHRDVFAAGEPQGEPNGACGLRSPSLSPQPQ